MHIDDHLLQLGELHVLRVLPSGLELQDIPGRLALLGASWIVLGASWAVRSCFRMHERVNACKTYIHTYIHT